MIHRQVRRALAGPLQYLLTSAKLPGHRPRDFQRATLEALYRWLMNLDAGHRCHIIHATGLGKTLLISLIAFACEYLDVLVVEPGKLLIGQNANELTNYVRGTIAHASSLKDIKDQDDRVIASHWKNKHHNLLVATDETLKSSYGKIKEIINPAVILVDEMHWLYTDAAQQALAAFPEAVIIGLTATPDYLTTVAKGDYIPVTLDNGQVLYCPPDKMARAHFGDLIDERSLRWGVQHNWLSPLAWGEIDFKFSIDDIPTVETPAGIDYNPRILQEVMRKNWSFVIDVVRKLYRSNQYDLASRYSVAVCPGADQAIEISQALRKIGIDADHVLGTTPDEERRVLLKHRPQFRSSVFVLREGWNDPRAEVFMPLRPMKSRVFYTQGLGRVVRLDKDNPKKVALALDPHYHNTRFAPLSAPILFGTPGQQIRRGDIFLGPTKGSNTSPYRVPDLNKLEPMLTVRPVEIEYWAGADGTFMADGQMWGTVRSIRVKLRLTQGAIEPRLINCPNRLGRDSMGKLRTFYPFSEAQKLCTELLMPLPKARKDGTIFAEGQVWATIPTLSAILSISNHLITIRCENLQHIRGKSLINRQENFYAVKDVKNACKDLLSVELQADQSGFVSHEGERWGTLRALARELRISAPTVKKKITNKVRRLEALTERGKMETFYALSEIKGACKNLVEDLPRLNSAGCFSDDDVWGTLFYFQQKLGISNKALSRRLKNCPCRAGKEKMGRRVKLYALSDVKRSCTDILKKNKIK